MSESLINTTHFSIPQSNEHKVIYKINSLKKEYGSGENKVTAVKSADFKVHEGEVVFIIGPSGSGKTTLLSMMGLLLSPTEGTLVLESREVSKLSQAELTNIRLNKLGFIFQNFKLIENFTVLENVYVVLKIAGMKTREAKERAKKIIEDVGLHHRLNFYPSKLSGGEKQRVAIARALANNPKLILADEPTANLDYNNGQSVCKMLRELVKKEKKALVIVTHDSRINWVADRIYHMEDGILREVETNE